MCRDCDQDLVVYTRYPQKSIHGRCPKCEGDVLLVDSSGEKRSITVGLSFKEWLPFQKHRFGAAGALAASKHLEGCETPTSFKECLGKVTSSIKSDPDPDPDPNYLEGSRMGVAESWLEWALSETHSWKEAVREILVHYPEILENVYRSTKLTEIYPKR